MDRHRAQVPAPRWQGRSRGGGSSRDRRPAGRPRARAGSGTDRRLADRRIYPAIDVIKSGTRKEELLYHPAELEKIYLLRQGLADLTPVDAMNLLLARLKKTATNAEFLLSMKE